MPAEKRCIIIRWRESGYAIRKATGPSSCTRRLGEGSQHRNRSEKEIFNLSVKAIETGEDVLFRTSHFHCFSVISLATLDREDKENSQHLQNISCFLFQEHTLRSTTLSGRSNSPTMQSGMAPPHGLALSSLRSKRTVSIPFSWAKISAAQAPEGPPPTTATLYFMLRALSLATLATGPLVKEEVVEKAEAVAATVARVKRLNFMVIVCRERN